MIRRSLALLAAILVLAACGSEPTAVRAPTEARQNASSLTVYVEGPTQVRDGECATWYSAVGGGTEPYQYSWSGLTTSDNTGEWVTGYISGPGYPLFSSVSVSVTDANGKTGFGYLTVYVPEINPNAVFCAS